jgi:3-oxoacyl-[acyl-carrier-protein] synthase II
MDASMKAQGLREVVVTGMGIVSAIGNDLDQVWQALCSGQSGLGPIDREDLAGNTVLQGGLVSLNEPITGKLRKADRTVKLAALATAQALAQAGLETQDGPLDMASIWGCGCGPADTLYESHLRFAEKGPRAMRPSTVPNCMANSVSAQVSIHYGLTGTNQVIVSACTSATNAIGHGFRLIHHGYADWVLCGGVDAFIDPFYYGVWNNLGVLSKIADAKQAVRPFDSNRQGTLLGEGAGALILEAAEHAQTRGVKIQGRILGYGESSDATHITNPSVEGQVRAIEQALQTAAVSKEQIGYINAHGTGTHANDATEAQSIRSVFGRLADEVPVGALKSFFGHTLGASGALETIATLMALQQQLIPPNLNCSEPDPDCAVRLAGAVPEPLTKPIALKNSFGFGGGNGVLVLSA